MWEVDHKEVWAPKNWCFRTVVLEKILEHPLDCKEIKPISCKRNQPLIFIGMLMLKLQYFGHLRWRADSLEKTLMLRKIEDKRRRAWQDEIVGWHHQLNAHESEQTPGESEGQGNLACCSSMGLQRVRYDLATEQQQQQQQLYPQYLLDEPSLCISYVTLIGSSKS